MKTNSINVFAGKSFISKLENSFLHVQEILSDCLSEPYKSSIEEFCDATGYSFVNALSPIMFAFSFLNSKSKVVMYYNGKEEVSESGCMSIFAVGETASGKTKILSKLLLDMMRWEKERRNVIRHKLLEWTRRVEFLEKKMIETKLTPEEALELKISKEELAANAPVFLSYTTPEKLLSLLSEKKMVALIDDEGESLVKNIIGYNRREGLNLGAMFNKLLDGTAISYNTKNNPVGVDLGNYSFGVYCNLQEEYLRKMEKDGDITNKLGRIDLIFITEAEKNSIANLSNTVGNIPKMEPIRNLMQDIYKLRVNEMNYKDGNCEIDGNYFMKVYMANNNFLGSMGDDTMCKRIHELVLKHRRRWADYARGLVPLCQNKQDLSKAVGAYLVCMIINIVRYYGLKQVSKYVTKNDYHIKELLKKNGIHDIIMDALEIKRRGGEGYIKVGQLRDVFIRATGKTGAFAFYNLIDNLKDKGVILYKERGVYEVVDFMSAYEIDTGEFDFDFGISLLESE